MNRHRLLHSLPTLGLGLGSLPLAPVHRCQELVRSQLLELVEPLNFLKILKILKVMNILYILKRLNILTYHRLSSVG